MAKKKQIKTATEFYNAIKRIVEDRLAGKIDAKQANAKLKELRQLLTDVEKQWKKNLPLTQGGSAGRTVRTGNRNKI